MITEWKQKRKRKGENKREEKPKPTLGNKEWQKEWMQINYTRLVKDMLKTHRLLSFKQGIQNDRKYTGRIWCSDLHEHIKFVNNEYHRVKIQNLPKSAKKDRI